MSRGVNWVVVGVSAALAVVVATMILTRSGDAPEPTAIVVPQVRSPELSVRKTTEENTPATPPAQAPKSETAVSSPATTQRSRPPARDQVPPRAVRVDHQAEDAAITLGRIRANHPGFTGSGFVDFDNMTASAVEWTVKVASVGPADVVVRYANGSAENRPMNIVVNGTLVAFGFPFPTTTEWENWQTVTVRVTLVAGVNKIRLTAITDNGGPDVDKITV